MKIIDEYFLKYGKYNQYAVKNEVAEYIKVPTIKNIINIFGNEKIINCDLEMEVKIDTCSMLSYLFYKIINPYEQIKLFEEDEKYKIFNYYIQVSFEVNNILKNLKIINVKKDEPEKRIPKGSIEYTDDLIPKLKTKDISEYVNKFIKKYDINIDEKKFKQINVENIVNKMGLTVIDSFRLKKVKGNKVLVL